MMLLLVLFCLMFLGTKEAVAGCEVSITDGGRFLTNSTFAFQLSFKNTGESNINWINIPTNFSQSISGINIRADGWNPDVQAEATVFTGWFLTPNETVTFDVSASSNEIESSSNWQLSGSETDGTDAFSCNTVTAVTLSSLTPPPTVVISGVVVSVGSTEATISWQTDAESTGLINYGTTAGYGNSLSGEANIRNHSVKIGGLVASTTYHYQIVSDNNNGSTATTDNTFTTSAVGVVAIITSAPVIVNTTTTVSTVITNTTIITPTPTAKPLADTVAPQVKISTAFGKPYKKAPTIEGNASDAGVVNAGVAKMDYSIDGGKNWIPVDYIDKVGKGQTSFEFTPLLIEDGNYQIIVRAADSTGNIGKSKLEIMVIDRLPPQVGGGVFLVGPMVINPDRAGNIYGVEGSTLRMAWSAVGGPIGFDMFLNESYKSKMVKNIENGLWESKINLVDAGNYRLKAEMVDGAKNETTYNLNHLVVLKKGQIIGETAAKVSVYVFEKTTNRFGLWDAVAYDQVNPMQTDSVGKYSLYLPEGKYYIQVEAKGKRMIRTEIFEINTPLPIVSDFRLPVASFWDRWWAKTVPINIGGYKLGDGDESPLVGKMISETELFTKNVLGKTSLISVVSSWMPQTIGHLENLEKYKNENTEVNVVAVFEQESASKIELLKKMGKYNFEMIADPDGVVTETLDIHSLPTNVFLDRKGIINNIYVGPILF